MPLNTRKSVYTVITLLKSALMKICWLPLFLIVTLLLSMPLDKFYGAAMDAVTFDFNALFSTHNVSR